jgi:hypothetical protein
MKAILLVSALCLTVISASAQDSYFPANTDTRVEGVTSFESEWYSNVLERMNEPRLPEVAKDVSADVNRVMILPTWGNPIVVRVEKHGELYSLHARRLDGQAGYDPSKLVESKDVELNVDDSRTVGVLIQNLKFFALPTDDSVRGFDGDQWIIEGVSHGKYHFAQRWCATAYNPTSAV